MGYLLQPSCLAANPSSITVAMAVNVPVGAGFGCTLFQSGVYNPNGQLNQFFSGLNVDYRDDGTFTGNYQLVFTLGSAQSALDGADCVDGDLTNPDIATRGAGLRYTSFVNLSSPPIAKIARGLPFHFLFAADLTSECRVDENQDPVSWNTASLVVDGVAQTLTSDNQFGHQPTAPNSFIPQFYSDRGGGDGPQTAGREAPLYAPAFGGFPGHDVGELFIPPWTLGVAGNPVGLPSTDGIGLQDSTKIQYRAVQAWLGQYIDPVSNYGKFAKPATGGFPHGILVKPSVAAASFGPQTYRFDGGKTSGVVNGGTGGPFTKIGTVKDATITGF
jgi:hypothetical protein